MSVPGNPAARLHSERLWRTDRKGDEDPPVWRMQREGTNYAAVPTGCGNLTPKEARGRWVPARKTVCG